MASRKWNVPKIWKNQTAFLLGGGPSLNDVDLGLIKDRRVIAVNNAYGDPLNDVRMDGVKYKPRDWVDVVWFGDHQWWDWHKASLKYFAGLKCHCLQFLENKFGTKRMHRGKPRGIETRDGYIAWNFNSGSSAINLAVHFGVSRIVLLGYDMRAIDGVNNWHHNHKKRTDNPYTKYLNCFPIIANDAKEVGVEILNATPDSAIKEFPIISLEEVL